MSHKSNQAGNCFGILPNRIPAFFIVLALSALAFSAACNRRSANEKRFELKGKVVTVEKDKRLVTVAHEDIKGYMPAMTMPFTIKDDWPFEMLAPGDEINATLVVDDLKSWLEDVRITQESPDANAGKTEGAIEAKAGDEVPDYALVNQDNKGIRLHDYKGKALALTFIYTRCPMPDQCTLMSNNFAAIDQELQKDPGLYQKTHLLSVSFDPDYDTPKVLRSYGASHTGRYSDENFQHWEFATGTKDQVKGVAQYFGLRYFADNDQIVHALRTIVIAPDGKVYKVYRGNFWKPEEVVNDLKAVALK